MVALAERQIGYMREHEPSVACGGRLIIAELMRGSIAITSTDLEEDDQSRLALRTAHHSITDTIRSA